MGSKLVLNRQKSSVTVQSAGSQYEEKIVENMISIYGPGAGPAAETLLKLAVKKLKADTETMVQADEANLKEISDDSQLLAKRDEKSSFVRSQLVDVRETGEVVYGSDFVRQLGFVGSTPNDPTAVSSLGAMVLNNLKTIMAPKPKRKGLSMDLSEWTGPLSAGIDELSSAILTVAKDKRDADQTLVAKQGAMESYDFTFSTTANLISNMLRAAGESDLANKVRPSTRKPGQTIDETKNETTDKTN